MNASSATMNDLAKACAHSADAAEWGELVRRSVPLASLVAMRICRMWLNAPSPATVDDIVQEIFLKLCERERRILRDFEPRGEDSFLGLLRLVSASVANDYFRRQHSAKRGGKVVTMPLSSRLYGRGDCRDGSFRTDLQGRGKRAAARDFMAPRGGGWGERAGPG